MNNIKLKTPVFQRDLGTLVAITSFTLVQNIQTREITANTTCQIYGSETAKLFTRHYGYHNINIVGNVNHAYDYSHEDLIAIETPQRLWNMPAEELENLTLRYEYKFMEKKVGDLVGESRCKLTVIDYFPQLPFYLQAVQGYAALVGDDSWANAKACQKAQEGFDRLYCWLLPYFEEVVAKKERKVVAKSIFIDYPETAALHLLKVYSIDVNDRLKELHEIYQKGVEDGTIMTEYPKEKKSGNSMKKSLL